jgi:hypothetical protein
LRLNALTVLRFFVLIVVAVGTLQPSRTSDGSTAASTTPTPSIELISNLKVA